LETKYNTISVRTDVMRPRIVGFANASSDNPIIYLAKGGCAELNPSGDAPRIYVQPAKA
jgi:hypothetical protein